MLCWHNTYNLGDIPKEKLSQSDLWVNYGSDKEHKKEFYSILNQNEQEIESLKKDKERLIEALAYELNNHEYCITGDASDSLEVFNLTYETVPSDILKKAINQAYGDE